MAAKRNLALDQMAAELAAADPIVKKDLPPPEVRDLDWYLNEARRRTGVPSDRRLSVLLDMSDQAVNQMRKRNVLPSDDAMVRLAHLAGVPVAEALIQLNIWRCKGPERQHPRHFYETILQQIRRAAATILIVMGLGVGVSPVGAHASATSGRAAQDQCILWKI